MKNATRAYAEELATFIVKEGNYPLIKKITIQTDWTKTGFLDEKGCQEGYETLEETEDEKTMIEILTDKIYEFQP